MRPYFLTNPLIRFAMASRVRWLRVITRTVSSPAIVPMISAHPAWSRASVMAPAEPTRGLEHQQRPDPVHADQEGWQDLRQIGTHGGSVGVRVVGASLRIGQLGETQLPDIAGEGCLGDHDSFRRQCFAQLVLTLDPPVSDDAQDHGVTLDLHTGRSSRCTSFPPT